MQAFMERHLELHTKRNRSYAVEEGKIFKPFHRLAKPIGPIAFDYTISSEGARRVMSTLNAFGVLFTEGLSQCAAGAWYAVISDRPMTFPEMSKKHRGHVRRGLRMCEVRRVEPEYIAREG